MEGSPACGNWWQLCKQFPRKWPVGSNFAVGTALITHTHYVLRVYCTQSDCPCVCVCVRVSVRRFSQ